MRELNPRVSPELAGIIQRLLAMPPVERFRGKARLAAEALEQAAEREGAEGDVPLFTWSEEHLARARSPEAARLAEEEDAAARAEHARCEEQARLRPEVSHARTSVLRFARPWTAAVAVGVLLTGLTLAVQWRFQESIGSMLDGERHRVAVGDDASSSGAGGTPPRDDTSKKRIGLPLPEQPFPGQNKPPCKKTGEAEIRGACWYRLADAKPPCKEEGKEDAYAWKGACYGPSYPAGREPTSSPQ